VWGVGWGGVDVHLCSRWNATLCYVEGCGWGGATRFMYTCVSTHWMLRLCYVDVHSRNTLNATLCCGRKWLRPNFWTYTCKKKRSCAPTALVVFLLLARNTIAIKRSKLPKSITKKTFTERYTFRNPSGRQSRTIVAGTQELDFTWRHLKKWGPQSLQQKISYAVHGMRYKWAYTCGDNAKCEDNLTLRNLSNILRRSCWKRTCWSGCSSQFLKTHKF